MNFIIRFLKLFVLGGLLGPLGDLCHVLSKTDGYFPDTVLIHDHFLKIPYWVPPLFASATAAIGLSHSILDRRLGKIPVRPGTLNKNLLWGGIFGFLFLYAISGFLPGEAGGGVDLILAVGALLFWFFLDRTWQGFLLAVSTAMVGTCFEMALVHFKIFYYFPRASNLNGVPSWLPWLYFSASIAIGNLGRTWEA